jgi:putative transposase
MAEVMTAVREESRLAQWSQTIRLCRESGLSNRAFCDQNGVSEKTYYYWLRKLKKTELAQETPPQLIKLNPRPDVSAVAVRLRLKGAELEIPEGTDFETLTMVLRALQNL